jgi:hypothetical protein
MMARRHLSHFSASHMLYLSMESEGGLKDIGVCGSVLVCICEKIVHREQVTISITFETRSPSKVEKVFY